jgi:hypothetical protein
MVFSPATLIHQTHYTPWISGSIFHGKGLHFTMDRGSKYHGKEVQYTLGRVIDIPW